MNGFRETRALTVLSLLCLGLLFAGIAIGGGRRRDYPCGAT